MHRLVIAAADTAAAQAAPPERRSVWASHVCGTKPAIFRSVCRDAGVPVQVYANRSDLPGGSTLGSIANSQVSLNTVDIGLAQLAMHSAYETAATADLGYLVDAMTEFYGRSLTAEPGAAYSL